MAENYNILLSFELEIVTTSSYQSIRDYLLKHMFW
jgi:hypothetical protein